MIWFGCTLITELMVLHGFFVFDGNAAIVWHMVEGGQREADDLETIQDVLGGNVDAFSRIVQRHQARILGVCRSYLGSLEEAEDACQEIFFRAFRSLHRFRLDRRFRPWLYAITLNHLKGRYRKNALLQSMRDRVRKESVPEPEDPATALDRKQSQEAVRRAVESLPPGLRSVVILYYQEQLSVAQVGEILSLGKENVKSKLHRARKAMRSFLEHDATDWRS